MKIGVFFFGKKEYPCETNKKKMKPDKNQMNDLDVYFIEAHEHQPASKKGD
jgi:hypothetical protein